MHVMRYNRYSYTVLVSKSEKCVLPSQHVEHVTFAIEFGDMLPRNVVNITCHI